MKNTSRNTAHNLKGQRSYKQGNSNQIMRITSVPVHIYWMYTSTNSLRRAMMSLFSRLDCVAEMILCRLWKYHTVCTQFINISCGIHVTDIFFCVFILFNISAGVRENTFTFMHLADALSKATTVHSGYTLYCQYVFPGKWTHNFCAANVMLYPLSHRNYIYILAYIYFCHSNLDSFIQTLKTIYNHKCSKTINRIQNKSTSVTFQRLTQRRALLMFGSLYFILRKYQLRCQVRNGGKLFCVCVRVCVRTLRRDHFNHFF